MIRDSWRQPKLGNATSEGHQGRYAPTQLPGQIVRELYRSQQCDQKPRYGLRGITPHTPHVYASAATGMVATTSCVPAKTRCCNATRCSWYRYTDDRNSSWGLSVPALMPAHHAFPVNLSAGPVGCCWALSSAARRAQRAMRPAYLRELSIVTGYRVLLARVQGFLEICKAAVSKSDLQLPEWHSRKRFASPRASLAEVTARRCGTSPGLELPSQPSTGRTEWTVAGGESLALAAANSVPTSRRGPAITLQSVSCAFR